ncbi:MAG: MBL fold metallo-hydrolase, partial [Silvanigrellaceae bacterium]|nr:MBL fold metallo-hydrolase [Silvanigrellaceae bacterium]
MGFSFSKSPVDKKIKQARKDRILKASNYLNGKFINSLPEKTNILLALKKYLQEKENNREPQTTIPILKRTKNDFTNLPQQGLRVTWLGHSSTIVEIDGARFLTDPVWGERVSPFSFMGPKRFFEPPLPLEELPALDAVVISHDHFDHLDKPTIHFLKNLNTVFVAPLGVGQHLIEWGIDDKKIIELNWWESIKISGVELFCTPARHFSGRGL